MENCPDCLNSILSQTPSLIGSTKCNTDCPTDIGCSDLLPSNCVYYTGNSLVCSNLTITNGQQLTDILGNIFTAICGAVVGNTVLVSSEDNCPGYLFSKITSDDFNITIKNPGKCEQIEINDNCWVWNTVLGPGSGDGRFVNNFNNAGTPFGNVRYSRPKGCIVRLSGVSTKLFNSTCLSGLPIFYLPVLSRPLNTKVYSINIIKVISSGCSTYIPATIMVDLDGAVRLFSQINNTDLGFNFLIPLDGIQIELN